jgi:hypothetical protein
MRPYLDDDLAGPLLTQALRRAGHDVETPSDAGLKGRSDPEHFTHSIGAGRVVATRNYRDYERLHLLILQAHGHHPGVLLVRRDNDPRRNLKPTDTVRALHNLETAGIPVADQCIVLNQWR